MTIKIYKTRIKKIEDDVNKLMNGLTDVLQDTVIYKKCKDENYSCEFFNKDRPKPIDFSAYDIGEFSKKDFPTKMHLKKNLTKEFRNALNYFSRNLHLLIVYYNRELYFMLDHALRIEEDNPDPCCPFCYKKDFHITKIDNYFDVFVEDQFEEETDTYGFISEHKGFCNLCGGKWIVYYDADDQPILFVDTWK